MNATFHDLDALRSGDRRAIRGARRRSARMTPSARSATPSAASFAALIGAIAERGDRDAFSALFGYYAPRVKSYMLRLGASPEAAEELAQETLLIVWRRAGAFDPARAAPSTWIFTIARNLRIDLARRAARPTSQVDPSDVVEAPPAPDAAFDEAQSGALIGRAVAALSADQAQVVRLAFFSDKPHARIAQELGLPLGTVKSRLRLAMGRLRAALEDVR